MPCKPIRKGRCPNCGKGVRRHLVHNRYLIQPCCQRCYRAYATQPGIELPRIFIFQDGKVYEKWGDAWNGKSDALQTS